MTNNLKNVEDQLNQLPSHQLDKPTKDHIYQNVMDALEENVSQPTRRRIDMKRITVGLASVAALTLFSIIGANMLSGNNQLTGDNEIIEVQPPIQQPEVIEQDPIEEQMTIEQKATDVVHVLHNRNMDELANYVHKEKGLLFSPNAYIEDYSKMFAQSEVATLLEDSTEYVWGLQEANTEIKLTPKDYFDKRIQTERFLSPDEVNVDPTEESGERSTNIKEFFPDSKVVEFHYAGTEQYGGMDWKSLYLVFEKDEDGMWMLVAIVSGLWAP
jgi:hypothetical protein